MTSPPSADRLPVIVETEAGFVRAGLDGAAGLTAAECASHAEILHRAHSIWVSRGCRDGGQLDDWLAAETEVRNEP